MQATQGAIGKFAKNFTEQESKSAGRPAPGAGQGVSTYGNERAPLAESPEASHSIVSRNCIDLQ
jgi:hypothetical protein